MLDKYLFDFYVETCSDDKLEDLCHELTDLVMDIDEHDNMYYHHNMCLNCAIAAKNYRKSKFRVRCFDKGYSGDMYKLEDFIDKCNTGELDNKNGIGFYADTPFNFTDVPVKPIHVLSNCHRTDFKYVCWFNYHENYIRETSEDKDMLDIDNAIYDFTPTDFDEHTIYYTLLDNKRVELCSKFCNKVKTNDVTDLTDLTDINDFDDFVKRFFNLTYNSETMHYE